MFGIFVQLDSKVEDRFVTFELQLWGSVVVFLAQKSCILERLMDDTLCFLVGN